MAGQAGQRVGEPKRGAVAAAEVCYQNKGGRSAPHVGDALRETFAAATADGASDPADGSATEHTGGFDQGARVRYAFAA